MNEEEKSAIRGAVSEIKAECDKYGARILAAVKTRTPEEIDFATHECGIDLIGENRVQELLSHYDLIKKDGVEIHFIGTLQKNKVKYLPGKVDAIESLSSRDVACEIQRQFEKHGKDIGVFIEINIGREESKSGIMPEELESFIGFINTLPRLKIRGLMTMAPVCSDDEYRRYFIEMRLLRDTVLCPMTQSTEKPLLSMGMSSSYKTALECGAGIIRPGSAIFGKRSI